MQNQDIEEIEYKVIVIKQQIQDFQMLMFRDGLSPLNYNHIGTLKCNLRVLQDRVETLLVALDD